jgi:hypothetical protein
VGLRPGGSTAKIQKGGSREGVNVAMPVERGMEGNERCRRDGQGVSLPKTRPRWRDGGRGQRMTG